MGTYSMQNVTAYIVNGQVINAIKELRSMAGPHNLGLKEAKDIVEGIRDAIIAERKKLLQQPKEFLVISRKNSYDDEYVVDEFGSVQSAMMEANDLIKDHAKVYLVGVISESHEVTKREMKAAA